jgi:signal transduction histidine kinase/CheY-like chemotaxis protein/signal transduction protein with GAF and PtsI domain/ligand-binding sensor protein
MNAVVTHRTRRQILLEDLGAERLNEILRNHFNASGTVFRLLNKKGKCVAQPGEYFNICDVLCAPKESSCITGPLAEANNAPGPVIYRCPQGVFGSIAAIRVAGDTVGYVTGLPSVAAPLTEEQISLLLDHRVLEGSFNREELQRTLRNVKVIPTDTQRLKEAKGLQNLVTELAQICWYQQQLQSIGEVNLRLATLSSLEEIAGVTLDGVAAILGEVNMVLYKLGDDASLHPLAERTGGDVTVFPAIQAGEGYIGWVAQHRQALLVPNADDEKEIAGIQRGGVSNQTLKSCVTVPMIGGSDNLVGVLQVASVELDEFHKEHQTLLQTLANLAALHLDRAASQTPERPNLLKELESLLQNYLDIGSRTIGFDSGDIGIIDASGEWLDICAAIGSLRDKLPPRISTGLGISGQAIRENRTVKAEDPQKSEAYREILQANENTPFGQFLRAIGSTVKTPLRDGGTVIGVLCVHWLEPREIPDEKVAALEFLAERIGVMLSVLRRRERLWADAFLVRRISNGVDVLRCKADLYQTMAQEGLRLTDSLSANVRVFDSQRRILRFVATTGQGWTDDIRKLPCSLDQPSAGAYAVKTGQPIVIPDAERSDNFWKLFPRIRSHVSIPISVRERPVAVLSVDSDQPAFYHEERVASLRRLATQCTIVLEHLALQEDRWLLELEKVMAAAMSVEELCESATQKIRDLFGVRGCAIFLMPPGAGVLRLATILPSKREADEDFYQIGEGLTGWVAQHRKLLRFRDTTDPAELKLYSPVPQPVHKINENIDYNDVKGHWTFLAAPLVVRDALVGVLRLSIKEDEADFTPDDEILAGRLCNDLALFIRNLWLAVENQKAVARLQALDSLGSALARTLNLKEVARTVLEEGLEILGCRAGHIRMFDPVARHLALLDAVGPMRDKLPQYRGLGEGISGRVFVDREHKPWVVTDASSDPRIREIREQFQFEGEEFLTWVQSETCVSLIVRNEPIGTLAVHWDRPNAFGNEEQEVLRGIADRAAVALKAAQLFDEVEGQLKRKIESLSRIQDLGLQFIQTLDLDTLLNNILKSALRESRASSGTLRIIDERADAWVLKAACDDHGASLVHELTPEISISDEFLAAAAQNGKPWSHADVQTDPAFRRFAEKFVGTPHGEYLKHLRSMVIVPISLKHRFNDKDRNAGVLILCSETPYTPGSDTLDFLRFLSAYAAVAIENAQLNAERERSLRLAQPLAMLGAMVAAFEHVLRNGLQNISGNLNNLVEINSEPEIGSRIARLQMSVKRLAAVMTDLALFAGDAPTSIHELVDVIEVVEKAVYETRFGLSDEERRPDVKYMINLRPIRQLRGNRVQIEQAVKLVLGNAAEAMPDGGNIEVATEMDGLDVVISIRDSGIGMDARMIEKCFEPFFTTKEGHARGLGLSVVFGIVKRHGGTVAVQSQPGKGTMVQMSFHAQWRNELTMPSVLIVDDDSDNRTDLSDFFVRRQWDVMSAGDGKQALILLDDRQFDSMILDLKMPIMGGMATLREVRNRPALDGMCVIVLTANGAVDTAVPALRQGAYQYLQKPFDFNDLLHLLRLGIALQKAEALQGELLSQLDIEKLLVRVLTILMEVLTPEAQSVVVLKTDGSPLLAKYAFRGGPVMDMALGANGKVPEFFGRIMASKTALFAESGAHTLGSFLPKASSVAAVLIPASDGRIVGVLDIESTLPAAFDRNWLAALKAFGRLIGVALRVDEATRAFAQAEFWNKLPLAARELVHRISTPTYVLQMEVELLKSKDLRSTEFSTLSQSLASSISERLDTVTEKASEVIAACALMRKITQPISLELSRFDLMPLFVGCGRVYQSIWEDDGIEIVLHAESDSPFIIEGDRSLIEYSLQCLMLNAREAIIERKRRYDTAELAVDPERPWRGLIDMHLRTEPDIGFAILSVSDSGTGISEEHLARLFQPLFTTKCTTGSANSGMGLFSVRQIMALHGGKVEVDAGDSVGASFRLLFPITMLKSGVTGADV